MLIGGGPCLFCGKQWVGKLKGPKLTGLHALSRLGAPLKKVAWTERDSIITTAPSCCAHTHTHTHTYTQSHTYTHYLLHHGYVISWPRLVQHWAPFPMELGHSDPLCSYQDCSGKQDSAKHWHRATGDQCSRYRFRWPTEKTNIAWCRTVSLCPGIGHTTEETCQWPLLGGNSENRVSQV